MNATKEPSARRSFNNRRSAAKGWRAGLDLEFVPRPNRTIVRRTHHGPLGMQRSFYPEGPVCHVYMLHPPGGVAGGDVLNLSCRSAAQSAALVTTPAATKFYRSDSAVSTVNQNLEVSGDLEWLPQESLYFSGCKVDTQTNINLANNSRFIGWDIQVFGRQASNALFDNGYVYNRLQIERMNTPILIDALRIDGNKSMQQLSLLNGNCVHGLLIATPVQQEFVDKIQRVFKEDKFVGVTLVEKVLLVRYLGNSAEQAKTTLQACWKMVRPITLGRIASSPRIWAT